MNTIKIALTFCFILFIAFISNAQIAINSDGSSPDASSMLDITGTDKGVLIPRMTTAQRESIVSPAIGLLVYDTNNKTFWYYHNEWIEILTDNQIYMNYDEEVKSLDIGAGAVDIKVSGNYLYIVEKDDDQISVYDISNPMSPQLASSLSFPASSSLREITINGDDAYVTSYTNTDNLWKLDISDPTNIISEASYDFGGKMRGVQVYSSHVFCTDNTEDKLRIMAINTIPFSEKSNLSINNPAAILVEDDYAYVASYDYNSSIYIIDISNPSTPTLVSTALTSNSDITSLKKIGNYLYIGNDVGSLNSVIDVSSHSSPVVISNVIPQSYGFANYGDLLITSSSAGYGFNIYEASDANNLSNIYSSSNNIYESIYDMVVNDTYLYLIDGFNDKFLFRSIATPYLVAEMGGSNLNMSFHDDMGNHIANENIQLSNLYISNDGNDEGISIEDDGTVNISDALKIAGQYTFPLVDGNANEVLTTDGNGSLSWTNNISAFASENGITVSKNNTDDFLFGADSLNYGTGTEYKFLFNRDKGAVRAGLVTTNYWDEDSTGLYSFSVGANTKATNYYSVALGFKSQSTNDFAVAMGDRAVASGESAAAFGSETTASGDYAVTFGRENAASGNYSSSFGRLTNATGDYAASFGFETNATGDLSTVFGYSTTASHFAATAFGSETTASGQFSTAFGVNSVASGNGATVLGFYTEASSYAELTLGTYNTTYTPNSTYSFDASDRLFVIGNGTGNNNRSDAMIIYKNGNTEINGSLTIDNQFTFPTTDGSANQVLTTDGAGNVNWQDNNDNDNQTIDNLELDGTTLKVSLSNDGQSDQSVDLSSLVPIGTIQMWATATPPTGWLICDGSTFSASTYSELNTVLGGNTLPDFAGRFPLGAGNSGTTGATTHNIGTNGGEEEHVLTISEMPAHSHGITHQSRNKSGSGTSVADLSGTGNSATTDSEGGGQAHNNMPPFFTINFIIKAE